MCKDMEVPLLAQVPLEPQLLISSEQGQCYMKSHPDTVTGKKFKEIVDKIHPNDKMEGTEDV